MTAATNLPSALVTSVPRFVHRVTDPAYEATAQAAEEALSALLADHPKAAAMHALLCADAEANAYWEMANYNTLAKLGFNDHGPIHAHLAASAAVQLLHLLIQAGQTPDIVSAGSGDSDDAFLIVLAGGLLHDVGNALTRAAQGTHGVILAQPILRRLLPHIYADPRRRASIQAFILSAIATHSTRPDPVTLEGGIVALADATDMTSGRGKIAFAQGKVDIHAVSAMSIRRVSIHPADGVQPIAIDVEMTSEAGLFQVEETLVRKLLHTTLRDLIAVRACMIDEGNGTKYLLDCVALAGRALHTL